MTNFIKPCIYKTDLLLAEDWDFADVAFYFINQEMREEYFPQLSPMMQTLCAFYNLAGQMEDEGMAQLYENGYDEVSRLMKILQALMNITMIKKVIFYR